MMALRPLPRFGALEFDSLKQVRQFVQATDQLGARSGDAFFQTSHGSIYKVPAHHPQTTQRYQSEEIAQRNGNGPNRLDKASTRTLYLGPKATEAVSEALYASPTFPNGSRQFWVYELPETAKLDYQKGTPLVGVLEFAYNPARNQSNMVGWKEGPQGAEVFPAKERPEVGFSPLEFFEDRRGRTSGRHLGHPIQKVWWIA
jgi:hypothetical protein